MMAEFDRSNFRRPANGASEAGQLPGQPTTSLGNNCKRNASIYRPASHTYGATRRQEVSNQTSQVSLSPRPASRPVSLASREPATLMERRPDDKRALIMCEGRVEWPARIAWNRFEGLLPMSDRSRNCSRDKTRQRSQPR